MLIVVVLSRVKVSLLTRLILELASQRRLQFTHLNATCGGLCWSLCSVSSPFWVLSPLSSCSRYAPPRRVIRSKKGWLLNVLLSLVLGPPQSALSTKRISTLHLKDPLYNISPTITHTGHFSKSFKVSGDFPPPEFRELILRGFGRTPVLPLL